MRGQTVSILEGNTFVVSDLRGEVDASPSEPHGLFHWDTRHLSRWKLTVDNAALNVLSTDDLQYFSAQYFLVPGTGTVYSDANWPLIRKRSVGDGFHEDLPVLNHGSEPLDLGLRLEADADFADLFEVKDALAKRGQAYRRVDAGHLVLGYQRETYVRETWILASAPEARFDDHGLGFAISVPPRRQPGAQDAGQVRPRGRRRSAERRHEPGGDGGACARAHLELGRPRGDLSAELDRPGRVAFLPEGAARPLHSRGGPALVHDDLRPRQPHHQPAGAALHAGVGRDDPAHPGGATGHQGRSIPRRGAGQDPARAALRRDDRLRGAAALAVLRQRRRHAAVPHPARRVRALDRQRRPGARNAPGGAAGAGLDRRVRRPRRRRLRRIRTTECRDRTGEPVLEGLLELDPVRRRHPRRVATGDVRDPGL